MVEELREKMIKLLYIGCEDRTWFYRKKQMWDEERYIEKVTWLEQEIKRENQKRNEWEKEIEKYKEQKIGKKEEEIIEKKEAKIELAGRRIDLLLDRFEEWKYGFDYLFDLKDEIYPEEEKVFNLIFDLFTVDSEKNYYTVLKNDNWEEIPEKKRRTLLKAIKNMLKLSKWNKDEESLMLLEIKILEPRRYRMFTKLGNIERYLAENWELFIECVELKEWNTWEKQIVTLEKRIKNKYEKHLDNIVLTNQNIKKEIKCKLEKKN